MLHLLGARYKLVETRQGLADDKVGEAMAHPPTLLPGEEQEAAPAVDKLP
jgi:hypothetical protein